ncbi:MAG: hypothetical protein ACREX3_18655, partial [Gammaproteobacteria bacterium]
MTPVNAPTPTGNTDTEAQEHPVAAVFWLLVAGLLGSVAALFAISLFHGSFARVASGLLGSLSGALLGAGISFYIRRWLTHDPAVGMREILDHALTDTGHLVETILAKDARMV